MAAVLVIGTGRSGTSLLMQALGALGLQMPKEAVPATENNLRGTGEEIAVRDQMLSLHDSLGPVIAFRPDDWQSEPISRQTVEWIADYLAENQEQAGEKGFAVKFPLTALYLPLWQEASRRANVPLKMLWATRGAPQTVGSLIKSYGRQPEVAMQTWAQRTYYLLRDAPADAMLLPYETWAADSEGLVRTIADFVGIADDPETIAAARQFSPLLDHSAEGAFEIAEPVGGIASAVDQLIAGRQGELREIVRRDDIDFLRLMTRLADAILALAPGVVPVAEETEMRTNLLKRLGDEANQETSEMKEEIAVLAQRIRDVSAENRNLKKELVIQSDNTAHIGEKTGENGVDIAWDPKKLSDVYQELFAARGQLYELQIENETFRSKLQNYEEEALRCQSELQEKEQSLKALNDEFEQASVAHAAMETEASEIREAYARLALQRDGVEEEVESRFRERLNIMEDRIEFIEQRRDVLRENNERIRNNNENLRKEFNALKKQRDEMVKKREQFRQKVNEVTARRDEIRDSKNAEIKALKAQLAAANGKSAQPRNKSVPTQNTNAGSPKQQPAAKPLRSMWHMFSRK